MTKSVDSQGFKNILTSNIDEFNEANLSDKDDSPDEDSPNDLEVLGTTSTSIRVDDSPEKQQLENGEGLIASKLQKQGSGGYGQQL